MAVLQVRDMPDDLYKHLSRVAQSENRSISQETIVLLRDALKSGPEGRARRADVLREIENLKIEGDRPFPDSALMIREDRDR